MEKGVYLIAIDVEGKQKIKSSNRRWTPEEDSIAMEELFPMELKVRELGRSEKSIACRMKRLARELSKDRPRERANKFIPRESDWKILRDTSLSAEKASELIGISKTSVYRYRKMLTEAYGISFRGRAKKKHREYTPEEIEILKNRNYSNESCSKLIGVSAMTVSYKRRELREQGIITWKR